MPRLVKILALCAAVVSSLSFSFADFALNGTVDGVEKVKSDIRASRYPFAGLGPWRLVYTGTQPAEQIRVEMLPTEAFVTEREADPRQFQVRLVKPQALLTELGNLVEIGVYVGDNRGGAGVSQCEISVSFLSTGTGAPIPLERIATSRPRDIKLSINPASAAQFVKFSGEKAIFSRKAGDSATATATLQLKDGGQWYTFSSALTACASTGSVSIPKPVEQKREKRIPVKVARESVVMRGTSDSEYTACRRAKVLAQAKAERISDVFSCDDEMESKYGLTSPGGAAFARQHGFQYCYFDYLGRDLPYVTEFDDEECSCYPYGSGVQCEVEATSYCVGEVVLTDQ